MSAIESVSHAAYAEKKPRFRGIALDLAAQVDDVCIDGAVGHVDAALPCGIEQLIAAQHPAPALDERVEQAELDRRDLDRPAVPPHFAAREVDFDLTERVRLLRGLRGAAQQRLDPRAQLPRAERLGDVIV